MSHKNILVLDTETDGNGPFSPAQQCLVQLAFIFNNDAHTMLVRGCKEMNPKVPHKITVAQCNTHGVSPQEAFQDFLRYLNKADFIVGHNIEFDLNILRHNMKSNNLTQELITLNNLLLKKKIICTMKVSTNICKIPGKYSYKWPKLEELYKHLFQTHIDTSHLHDALEDCKVTQKCFHRLQERGIFS